MAFAAVSPVAPKLVQKLGLEKTLLIAVVGLAVGILVRSLPLPGIIWVGTACIGVSIAVLNVSLPVMVKRDFPARIGSMTGIYSAVQGGFAAMAAGIALPLASASDTGWRFSLGVWAVLAVVTALLLVPQARTSTVGGGSGNLPQRRKAINPWRSSLSWQIAAFMGVQSLFFYTLLAWLSPIEQSFGISAETAGFHQFLFNLGSLFGSLLCTALLPKTHSIRPLMLFMLALWIVSLLGLLFFPELAVIPAFTGGLSCGTFFVLALSLFGLRTRHHVNAGALSGMGQSVGYIIAAAGPLAIGALHDATDSWSLALWLLVVLGLIEVVLGVMVSRDRYID
ncbi:cyanate transporter [Rothia aerolata]|uniref:Cyanate transporter n=1 Tax=Rothia aerolata TaxID=1812262 RepID=A0A917IQL0_9MICC|nr:cyanate transporter [Rothia aerolata]